mgnify:CR=1 FL=1
MEKFMDDDLLLSEESFFYKNDLFVLLQHQPYIQKGLFYN